ncbi:hypothetical protein Hanom_Chr15g01344711 [Helianthus anomalus]
MKSSFTNKKFCCEHEQMSRSYGFGYVRDRSVLCSELQVLSFIFIPNCRRCHLSLKLTSFVLNVLKSCMLCPLVLT